MEILIGPSVRDTARIPLAAVFRHQLSAPVEFDLGMVDEMLAGKLRTLCAARGLLLRSLEDLFFHPNPPVELLELAKQFAKACHEHPESPLPPDVATALYLTSIVVALVRCGRRITTLDDASLRSGIEWLISRNWIDDRLRELLREGSRTIGASTGSSP